MPNDSFERMPIVDFQLQTARLLDSQVDIDIVEEITDMFIEAGIHLDAINIEGLTAAQLCISREYPSCLVE